MTGPFDLFTTSKSGDIVAEFNLGAPASLAAWAARAWRVQVVPVITAAAPMMALRMTKVRRSMLSERDDVSGKAGNRSSLLSCGFMAFYSQVCCFGNFYDAFILHFGCRRCNLAPL